MKKDLTILPVSYSEDSFRQRAHNLIGKKGELGNEVFHRFGKETPNCVFEVKLVAFKDDIAISQMIRDQTQIGWIPGNVWHLLLSPGAVTIRSGDTAAFPSTTNTDPKEFPTLYEWGYTRRLKVLDLSELLGRTRLKLLFVRPYVR